MYTPLLVNSNSISCPFSTLLSTTSNIFRFAGGGVGTTSILVQAAKLKINMNNVKKELEETITMLNEIEINFRTHGHLDFLRS